MNRILIADRYPIFRLGIRQLIEERMLTGQIDEVDSEPALFTYIKKSNYQLILVDIAVADKDARTLIRKINLLAPAVPVLVFASGDEMIFAAQALHAGAKGYIQKTAANHEMQTAISKLIAGKFYIGSSVTEDLVIKPGKSVACKPFGMLSRRETEVARHLVNGISVGDISGLLSVSYITVHTLKKRIFEKLRVKNLIELARLQDAFGNEA